MKPSTHLNKSLLHLAVALLFTLSFSSAKAQVLLTINVYDPNNVTITATGAIPGASGSDIFLNGVDLLGFFTQNVAFPPYHVVSSSLTTGDASSGPLYDSAIGDNYDSGGNDLALYSSSGGGSTESFTASTSDTTGSPAFLGEMILKLNGAPLPTAGTEGNIITGFSYTAPNNVVIGQYDVESVAAPEPSSWLLCIGSLTLLAIYRWRSIRLGARSGSQND